MSELLRRSAKQDAPNEESKEKLLAPSSSSPLSDSSITKEKKTKIPLSDTVNVRERQSNQERRHTALLIALTVFFLFADQNLMAPNLTAIAEDFGFTDEERDRKLGGEIALAFFLLGAPVSLLVGYFADLLPRGKLLSTVVFLGELPVLATILVTTYTQLFWLRALTGIAIGGALPLTFSLVGDLYDSSYRSTVAALLSLSVGGGIIGGQIIAGLVGPKYGWRTPFVIVSLPNMLLSLINCFVLKEPPRGQMEEVLITVDSEDIDADNKPVTVAAYSERINASKVLGVYKIKTNLLIFLQGIPGTVPWGAILVYLNDYLAQNKGLSVGVATFFVAVFGAGGAIGGVGGGMLGQKIYNKKKFLLPICMGASCCLGVIPLLYILNAPLGSGGGLFDYRTSEDATELAIGLIVCFVGGIFSSASGPNIRAILLNVNTPETRGTAFSLYNLMDDLGKGLGPLIVSVFIEEMGRTSALNLSVIFWFISGALQACMAYTLHVDLGNMEKSLIQATANSNTLTTSSLEFEKNTHTSVNSLSEDDLSTDRQAVELTEETRIVDLVSDEYSQEKERNKKGRNVISDFGST